MSEVHDNPLSVHMGRDRMVCELERRVYWPNMRKHVTAWIQACVPCQRNKIDRRKPQGLLGILMPWDKERKTQKLRARFYGPFEILEQLGPVSYRLKIPKESKIHDVFHVALFNEASQGF